MNFYHLIFPFDIYSEINSRKYRTTMKEHGSDVLFSLLIKNLNNSIDTIPSNISSRFKEDTYWHENRLLADKKETNRLIFICKKDQYWMLNDLNKYSRQMEQQLKQYMLIKHSRLPFWKTICIHLVIGVHTIVNSH